MAPILDFGPSKVVITAGGRSVGGPAYHRSMTTAPETITLVQGWVVPAAHERVDAAAVLARLRTDDVLGAVQSDPVDADEPLDVVVATDDGGRVLVVDDGRLVPGERFEVVAARWCADLGVSLETDDHVFADPRHLPLVTHDEDGADSSADGCVDCACGEVDPDAPGDLLLSRVVPSSLPMLAHHAGCGMLTGHVEGWNVALFDEMGVDLSDEGFLRSEVPAVLLTDTGARCYVEVLPTSGAFPGVQLTRQPDLEPTFSRNELDLDVVDGLSNPHLMPGSDLLELLDAEPFADLDPATVAAALQTRMDAGWSARVLTALGLPPAAADVHSGRRSLAEVSTSTPDRVEALPLLRALVSSTTRYHDAPAEEVARRGAYGRLYARLTDNLALSALLYATETAVGAVLLDKALGGRGPRGRRALAGAAAATLLTDAVMGVALTVRKHRR